MHRGRWLLRIEDIDPPREQPGAAGLILDALERYGFEWDGAVLYQSNSLDAHLKAIAARGTAARTRPAGRCAGRSSARSSTTAP